MSPLNLHLIFFAIFLCGSLKLPQHCQRPSRFLLDASLKLWLFCLPSLLWWKCIIFLHYLSSVRIFPFYLIWLSHLGLLWLLVIFTTLPSFTKFTDFIILWMSCLGQWYTLKWAYGCHVNLWKSLHIAFGLQINWSPFVSIFHTAVLFLSFFHLLLSYPIIFVSLPLAQSSSTLPKASIRSVMYLHIWLVLDLCQMWSCHPMFLKCSLTERAVVHQK